MDGDHSLVQLLTLTSFMHLLPVGTGTGGHVQCGLFVAWLFVQNVPFGDTVWATVAITVSHLLQ